MQWKSPRYMTNALRTRVRFAWLPVLCAGEVKVYLERYTVIEQYVRCGADGYWDVVKRIAGVSRV